MAEIACITSKPTATGFIRSYTVEYNVNGSIWKQMRDSNGNPKVLYTSDSTEN